MYVCNDPIMERVPFSNPQLAMIEARGRCPVRNTSFQNVREIRSSLLVTVRTM